MYDRTQASNLGKQGKPVILATRMHMPKSLINILGDMDAFVTILRARKE